MVPATLLAICSCGKVVLAEDYLLHRLFCGRYKAKLTLYLEPDDASQLTHMLECHEQQAFGYQEENHIYLMVNNIEDALITLDLDWPSQRGVPCFPPEPAFNTQPTAKE